MIMAQVNRRTRPDSKNHGFEKTETLYQLRLEVDVDSARSDLMTEDFMTQLWYQSMYLSDLLKHQQINLG